MVYTAIYAMVRATEYVVAYSGQLVGIVVTYTVVQLVVCGLNSGIHIMVNGTQLLLTVVQLVVFGLLSGIHNGLWYIVVT